MMIRDVKRSVLALGVFLVPTILVKGTAILTGQGPPSASAKPAHPSEDPPPVLQPYVAVWAEDQLVAAKHNAWIRTQPFAPSPLLHQVIPKNDTPDDEHRPTTPEIVAPPSVNVQAILRSPGGNIARINRKIYHEGDAFEDSGWIIKKIDPDNRSVLIVHPETGAEVTAVVALPLAR